MDFRKLLEKFPPVVKKHMLTIALAVLGLMFLIYGVIALVGANSSSSNDVIFESGQDQANESGKNATSSGVQPTKNISVDVEGAVMSPGVYNVSYNSRIKDGVVAAGGLSVSADRNWISKNLNMAQKIADGAKIYIPKTGENVKEGINVGTSTENLSNGQINVNAASIQDLDRLSGVGIVTAQKIIDARPYSTIDELLSKKILSKKVFDQIKGKITIY